jgi:hypothetical protein
MNITNFYARDSFHGTTELEKSNQFPVILFGILTPLALGILFVVIMKNNKQKPKNETDIVHLNPYDDSSRSFEDLSIDSTMMVIENQKPVHQMQCLENCSIEINNQINQSDLPNNKSNETITLKKEKISSNNHESESNNQNSESNEFKSNIINVETLPFTVIKKVLKKENSTNELKPVIHQVVLEKPTSENEIPFKQVVLEKPITTNETLLKPVIHQEISEKPISKNLDDNKIEEEETQISMNNPNDESKIFSNDLLKKVDNETSSDSSNKTSNSIYHPIKPVPVFKTNYSLDNKQLKIGSKEKYYSSNCLVF